MKKSTKTFTGSVAALASVASIIAPAATVFAAEKTAAEVAVDHVAYAEKTLNFFDFNLAFSKVVALGDKHPQYFELLARLGKIEDTVKTPEIKAILKAMDDLAANKDLANYTKLEKLIADTIKEEKNNLYLRGELNSWGHEMVYTADVQAAIDAVNAAWVDKTPAKIAAAKEAVSKVKNAGSLAWLNGQVTEIEVTLATTITQVKAVGAKKVEVKFNKPVDTTNAVITLKKGSVSTNVEKVTFSADKTVATIETTTKLTKTSDTTLYTVTVKGLDKELTATTAVEEEKVSKIEITSTTAPMLSSTSNKATVRYQVSNQFSF